MKSKLIYVDTNVFVDFFHARDYSAYLLFMKTLSCKYSIVVSDITCFELQKLNLHTECTNIIKLLEVNKKIKYVKTDTVSKKRANCIELEGKTHYTDALHKVLHEKSLAV